MKKYNEFVPLSAPAAIALGYFDGVHLGHRAVIDGAVKYAREAGLESAVFTFTLDDGLAASRGGDILSAEERLRRVEALGVQHYICPPATSFYGKSAQWFVEEILHGRLGVKAVFCGASFTFGKEKAGIEQLRQMCAPFGIEVHQAPDVLLDGSVVSSTRIRAALQAGEIGLVNRLLGKAYAIDFEVVHGKQLGRTIGCPTVNQLYPGDMCAPLYGVYITSVEIGGALYPAATGFGTRPTVHGEYASAETFIEGFSGDLYGQHVRTRFYKYLCPQKEYQSLEELARFIHEAAKQASAFFETETP